MSQSIAVINAGSSSIKFALYDAVREEICFFRGQIGGIGVAPRLKVADPKGEIVEERAFSSEGFDHDTAMREILSVGAKLLRGEPVAAFGHRVVHGGVRYDSPVRVTSDVLDDLAQARAIGAASSAAQSRRHSHDLERCAANSPGSLLRHGLSSQAIVSCSGIRPAASVC